MSHIPEKLYEFDKKLPRFDDGRIDYSNTDEAMAVLVFVLFQEKVLFLKRSEKVRAYKGKWDVIAGYYDELVEPERKALIELEEEVGIKKETIEKIVVRDIFLFHDKTIHKTWHDVPVYVVLKKEPNITIDWEHTEYCWIDPENMSQYDCVSGLKAHNDKIIETIQNL